MQPLQKIRRKKKKQKSSLKVLVTVTVPRHLKVNSPACNFCLLLCKIIPKDAQRNIDAYNISQIPKQKKKKEKKAF